MIISRNRVETMQRTIRFKDELVKQYSRQMVRMAEDNGTLQAELLLARAEIAHLKAEVETAKAEKGDRA